MKKNLTDLSIEDLIALPADQLLALRKTVAEHTWEKSDVPYKLKPCQFLMNDAIDKSKHLKYVLKCSRRIGKSFFLCWFASKICRKPNAQVRYGAPDGGELITILYPIMRRLFQDAPQKQKPVLKESLREWQFPNGSIIHMSGLNKKQAEKLRGNACDLFIIDEAGFVDDLPYIINDIAMPQFLDPDGKVISDRRLLISSSPARTPAHPFTEIANTAEAEGCYSHFDIYQGGYPTEVIELFKKEAGGEESSTWQREYLALDVIDKNYALVPEWDKKYVEEPCINEYFKFFYKYVSLDIGVRDLTVGLFAHYDFQKTILYVHDEVVMNGPEMTTEKLAKAIRETEKNLFKECPVRKRVSDIDLLLLNDLRALHSLYFEPTDKGKLEEMVNEVRIWVNSGKIRVAPKCEQLIGCLAKGVWNENRTDFDRAPKYGHFDALASLMYLVRNIDFRTNPIPHHYGKSEEDTFFTEMKKHEARENIRTAFNVRTFGKIR